MSFKTYAETGKFESDFSYILNEGSEPQFVDRSAGGATLSKLCDGSTAQKEIKNAVKKAGFEPSKYIFINFSTDEDDIALRFKNDDLSNEYLKADLQITFDKNLKQNVFVTFVGAKNLDADDFDKFSNSVSKLNTLVKFFENYNFSKSDIVVLQN